MDATILVNISLHGVFRIDRFKQQIREYPQGTTAGYVINELEIPATLLGIILVNGAHTDAEKVLLDGDLLMLLPILEGG